jgi:hypothetical protein
LAANPLLNPHAWKASHLDRAPYAARRLALRQALPTREPDMRTTRKAFPLKHLIIMTSSGTIDLVASKSALKTLAADPEFDKHYEVLLDLRDSECELSVMDVYEIATYLAWPDPALPTRKKIAVLVSGQRAFDHAKFLEVCSTNRGIQVGAFEDYDKASEWLDADLPEDRKEIDAMPNR